MVVAAAAFFRGNFNSSSFTVSGVDLTTGALGPLSSAKLTSGRTFASADATSNVAVVNSDYATQKKLKVGSTITVAKTSFKVVGIASARQQRLRRVHPAGPGAGAGQPEGQGEHDLRGRGQRLEHQRRGQGDLRQLPKATVTTSSSLASEVTGSLSNASSLANNLGKWLAIAVLVAAFLLASLLTMAAVARRVREFGTLKALGWRSRRIVGQVMGESIAIGIVGGVVGVALGFAGATLVTKLTSPLSASLPQTTGSATPGGARTFGGGPGGRLRRGRRGRAASSAGRPPTRTAWRCT